MNISDWLNKEIVIKRMVNLNGEIREISQKVKILERLTELIIANGGRIDVQSWGNVAAGGPVGRIGLVLNEAIELISLGAMLSGILIGLDQENSDIPRDVIQKEINRIEREGFDLNREEKGRAIKIYDEYSMKKAVEGSEQIKKKLILPK